jgi:hypothetical protein
VTTLSLSAIVMAALVLVAHVSLARQSSSQTAKMPSANEPVPAATPFVEEHAHFDEKDPAGAVRSAMAALGRENAAMIVFQISPDTFDHPGRYDSEIILSEVKKHPGKLAITGGGGSLNAMIMKSVATGDAGPEVQKQFKARAEELLREGVIGFGEMTAEHFDGFTPYQAAPPDHPLFLMLADAAALGPDVAAECAAIARQYRGVRTTFGAQSARKGHLGAFGFGLHRISNGGT